MTARTAAQHTIAELRYTGCTEDREVVFFAADSASKPGKVHEVTYDRVTRTAHCNCTGAECGRQCWHMDLAEAAYFAELARQFVARQTSLTDVAAIGRQAKGRLDACGALWALQSPLDQAIYRAARCEWRRRTDEAAAAAAVACATVITPDGRTLGDVLWADVPRAA